MVKIIYTMETPTTKHIVYRIFIGNVDYNLTKEDITKEFNQMNLGTVEEVEMIEKKLIHGKKTNFGK